MKIINDYKINVYIYKYKHRNIKHFKTIIIKFAPAGTSTRLNRYFPHGQFLATYQSETLEMDV